MLILLIKLYFVFVPSFVIQQSNSTSQPYAKDPKRRQSWHEKRGTNPTLDDSPGAMPPRHSLAGNGGMRKSVSIDTLKSTSSFKKLRGVNDNSLGKGKVTPVKATYRPASMNLEAVSLNMSSNSLNEDHDDDHSGEFCVCVIQIKYYENTMKKNTNTKFIVMLIDDTGR